MRFIGVAIDVATETANTTKGEVMKLPTTVETEGGIKLTKRFGFAGIGMYKHPRTGNIVVIDFREEWKAEA